MKKYFIKLLAKACIVGAFLISPGSILLGMLKKSNAEDHKRKYESAPGNENSGPATKRLKTSNQDAQVPARLIGAGASGAAAGATAVSIPSVAPAKVQGEAVRDGDDDEASPDEDFEDFYDEILRLNEGSASGAGAAGLPSVASSVLRNSKSEVEAQASAGLPSVALAQEGAGQALDSLVRRENGSLWWYEDPYASGSLEMKRRPWIVVCSAGDFVSIIPSTTNPADRTVLNSKVWVGHINASRKDQSHALCNQIQTVPKTALIKFAGVAGVSSFEEIKNKIYNFLFKMPKSPRTDNDPTKGYGSVWSYKKGAGAKGNMFMIIAILDKLYFWVVPLTTQLISKELSEAQYQVPTGIKDKTSGEVLYALCHQIHAICADKFGEYVSNITSDTMQNIVNTLFEWHKLIKMK